MDSAGKLNTKTGTTAFSSTNPRSAITADGTQFWMGGFSGVLYTTAAAPSTVVTLNNINSTKVGIFNSQLYASSASSTVAFRLGAIGTGLPVASGQSITNLPGSPTTTGNPQGYVFFDTNGDATNDLLYVADASSGVLKYYFNGTNWIAKDTFAITGLGSNTLRAITGTYTAGNVLLFAVTSSSLLKLVDTASPADTLAVTRTVLATAAAKTAFKSVTFTPGTTTTTSSGARMIVSSTKITPFTEELISNNYGFKVFDVRERQLQVSVFTDNATAGVLQVTDMGGRRLASVNLQLSKGTSITTVSLPAVLSAGVYVAALITKEKILTTKFIK